jgi:hypothetical protein
VQYHPGHVRKLLHSLGYSVQRPRRRLARANAWEQDRWAHRKNWALIFTDEASFRQDTTLQATWSRVGRAPEFWVTGERKTVKILGAIELGARDSTTDRTASSTLRPTWPSSSCSLNTIVIRAQSSSRTMPPIIGTQKCGAGLVPIAIGWKYTNCRRTPRN